MATIHTDIYNWPSINAEESVLALESKIAAAQLKSMSHIRVGHRRSAITDSVEQILLRIDSIKLVRE